MALKGYHSYRGRQGLLRRLLVIVLFLVLIAACAFLFLQRYITYSDDGSFYLDLPFEINWEIPFLNDKDPDKNPNQQPEQDFNLIIDRPQNEQDETKSPDEDRNTPDDEETSGQEDPGTEQESGEDPPKVERYTTRRLIELAQLPPDEAALIDALASCGADGFSFVVKNRGGRVSYASAKAIEKAVGEDVVSRDLISRLCAQEDVYTVARINCFHDSLYAFANMKEAGICQKNGYIWYESDSGGHWLDPEKAAARQYVIDLAVECAQMGFDELLLEEMQYPVNGKLHKIDFSQNTMEKAEALALFLSELRSALEPYGVSISLLLDEAVIRGLAEDTEDSGLVAQQILPLVDAVYVSTEDIQTARQEMNTILDGKNMPVLVSIVGEATAEAGWYLIG